MISNTSSIMKPVYLPLPHYRITVGKETDDYHGSIQLEMCLRGGFSSKTTSVMLINAVALGLFSNA